MFKHAFILFFISSLLPAFNFDALPIYSTDKGFISFHSDAPLELITAASNELRARFDTENRAFAFSVKINSFSGFNNPLQKEHFNENYLETAQYPTATFSGKIIEEINFSVNGTYSVRAKGNLSIHGVVQERIIKSDLVVKDGKISIHSNFTVHLADHNIPIPKIVHEKLASEIKVEVKADLAIP